MSKNLLINANDMSIFEPRRYYQEYEGTFITATNKSEDDTLDTSRYIEVTEIWGNTVQDENNLEDIQSVGELYVDEEGNPIFDELGREQYKIEVESCNGGEIQKISAYEAYLDGYYYKKRADKLNGYIIADNVLSNMTYSIKFTMKKEYVGTQVLRIYEVLNDIIVKEHNIMSTGTPAGGWEGEVSASFVVANSNCRLILGVNTSNALTFYLKDDINLSIGNSTINKQSHKTTILLPCQLQKVGDVYDRLYWDNEKCRYVIEKKIFKWVITVMESSWRKHNDYTPGEGFSGFNFTINQVFSEELLPKIPCLRLGNNGFGSTVGHTSRKRGTDFHKNGNGKLSIEENLVPNDSLELLKEWLENNYSYIYYELKEPLHIETNITEKILLPCYEEKAHIFVNSTIDATMKVLVPYKEII